MSSAVTQADADILTAEIRQRSETLKKLRPRIRWLWVTVVVLRFVVCYFSAVSESRIIVQHFGIWRQGIFLVAPIALVAIATILTNILTGQQGISIIVGAAIACASPVLLWGLLVYPATEIVTIKRDAAAARISDQIQFHRRSKEKSAELSQANRIAERRLRDIQATLAYLRKVRSREYNLQQLFNRNWRAMRSVEFEQYLEEVFVALGYSVEMTKVTGDQGVDLVVSKSGMRIAIQVKGYLNSVSNSAVQEAFAGMAHYNCDACAVITNSVFTSSAEVLAQSTRCVLIGETIFRDFVLGRFDLVDNVPHP